MWLAQYTGPCLAVCVFVLTLEIDMVAGGHGAHTLPFCLHELTPHTHTHIPKTHSHSVKPHPCANSIKPSHLGCIDGRCDGAKHGNLHAAAATASVHARGGCLSAPCIFPSLLPFLPAYHVQIWYRYSYGPEKTQLFSTCTENLTDPKINTQQVYSFKELTAVLIRDLFKNQPTVCFHIKSSTGTIFSFRFQFVQSFGFFRRKICFYIEMRLIQRCVFLHVKNSK